MLFILPLVGPFSLVSFLLLYSLKSGKVPIAVNKLINSEKMHKNISKKHKRILIAIYLIAVYFLRR